MTASTSTLPRAVDLLHRRAVDHGWRVDIATLGRLGAPRFTAIYLRRGDEAINAVWTDGKFDSAWRKVAIDPQAGGVSPQRIGSRELTAVVTGVAS